MLWPALLAGLVALGVTLAIERFGGVVGGLIGTMPTTIVAAGLGLWSGDGDAFTDAMGVVPAGMLLNAGFLWLWRALPPRLPPGWTFGRRLATMTVASLATWAVGAVLLVLATRLAREAGAPALALGLTALLAVIVAGVAATWTPRPAPRGTRRVGLATLLARGALAAIAIGVAVVLQDVGGPLAAGVAAVFPAIFVTTMVSLWLAQGEAVPAGAIGPMMLGSASVGAYALMATWTFPALGPWLGTLAAWVLTVLTTTLPAWWWLRLRA